MRAIVPFLAVFAALSACDQAAVNLGMKNPSGAEIGTCVGSSAPSCRFRNSPVRLEQQAVRLPGRKLPFFPIAEELEFVDASNRSWIAPSKTLTDGASIPRIFVSIVGNPTSQEFTNAAAIHDAYCGVGNEAGPKFHTAEWRSVHRMFYDALRVGGTPETKAKIMYAAVYIGGPRWGGVRQGGGNGVARDTVSDWTSVSVWNGDRGQVWRRDMPVVDGAGRYRRDADDTAGNAGLSPGALRQVLRKTIGFIESRNPTLPEIESFADASLSQAVGVSDVGGEQDDGASDTGNQSPVGDPTTGAPVGDPTVGAPGTGASTAPAIGGTPADPAGTI
ncbi:DUF1353 domain-containing protein [Alisedimentitalea sp. MJ-SS2]|uniref:DUF1353 domain-containing protein n=1 Tax=Aliisedimentitalea sp. MJ-SS2 TaxID=3049795 RepID=UPI002912B917|nr:DUF1353 domain-containing protein [Alisedimentitalea sp. MJ-SS2]MDU8929886.1 DUF1353 domain-containing protein [Alisedimentitalea sp. MJ-SS2]